MRRQTSNRKSERGFTLTEMLIATVVVIFGLVAVAQLVPASVMMSTNNRDDGTALAFAQREIDVLRAQPLSALTFSDPQGVSCPSSQVCALGDPTRPLVAVGCDLRVFNGAPVIDFSMPTAGSCTPGYYFTYVDPNDPAGETYDVRWNVMTSTNSAQTVTYRRIWLGVFRRGTQLAMLPVTLDVQVEK
jgi:type II secretory pathway pseudopilin PulG